MHAQTQIATFWPILPALRIHGISLGPERAHLREGEVKHPPLPGFKHGNVSPRGARETARLSRLRPGERHCFLPRVGGPGEVGAKEPLPPPPRPVPMAKSDLEPVSHIA